ncbi:MAG: hypothetical protein IBX47_01435 [Desulfuromonadales bacterium]|nr:hypothetical protein [Desulfuromonadales bacterium]
MLTVNTKQMRGILLLAIALFGLSVGYCAAQFSGWLLMSVGVDAQADVAPTSRTAATDSVNIDAILSGNIFDPTARAYTLTEQTTAEEQAAAPVQAVNLRLHGTVDGGENPLALIEAAGKVLIYHIGDSLPGGAELLTIERSRVLIRQSDGREAELLFDEGKGGLTSSSRSRTARTRSADDSGNGIRDLGGNRWEISQEQIDKARSNLGSLLKQARLEPNIVNGQTDGFVVRMIRPQSLLAHLGLKVGDVVNAVNGVELDSPEKALQIFQQLREAKRLTIDLARGQEQMSFEYEVN